MVVQGDGGRRGGLRGGWTDTVGCAICVRAAELFFIKHTQQQRQGEGSKSFGMHFGHFYANQSVFNLFKPGSKHEPRSENVPLRAFRAAPANLTGNCEINT